MGLGEDAISCAGQEPWFGPRSRLYRWSGAEPRSVWSARGGLPHMSSQEPGLSPARQPGWLDESKTDEELRTHQLRLLRRRWLKDQELSPREPVLPPRKLGPVERFWVGFLEPGSRWRRQVFKTYNTGVRIFVYVLVPTWVIHYYLKYQQMKKPHGIHSPLLKVYPGDVIQETGEVIPPLEIPSSHR